MARYLQVAAEANKTAIELVDMVPDEIKTQVAVLAGHLVNYGIRCNPRPAQSTVRLNAVREAMKGLPVSVSMETRVDEVRKSTYNVLLLEPKK